MTSFQEAVRLLKEADGERDYIVISSPISRNLHYRLSRLLASKKKHSKCTVFLTTYGGDPDGGFRIGRCLRHHYPQHVRVAVPSWCKSAGTLVAIAADELAIGDFGELGPLDVQVHKGSELQERSSGLDIIEALGAVTAHAKMTFHEMLKETRGMGLSTKLSAEFAAQVSSAVAAPLFSQIDPMRIGEMQRATRIAYEYGERLNSYSNNLKPDALTSLIKNYPSHSFVIDRKEAAELFNRVFPLNDAEQTFAEVVWELIQYQGDLAELVPEDAPAEHEQAVQGDDNDDEAHEPEGSAGGEADSAGAGDTGPEEQRNGAEPSTEGLRLRTNDSAAGAVFVVE